MTNFDVNTIISHINKNWFLKQQYYQVKIFGSGDGKSLVSDSTPDIMLNCSAVTIPGINLGTNPDKRHGIGLTTNLPNAKSLTAVSMTFYQSEYDNERNYFINWLDSIYNKESKRFNFYKEYIKNIIVEQYNRKGELISSTEMQQCYPIFIGTLDKGYGLDGIAQFNISFTVLELKEIIKPSKNNITWD